MFCRFNAYCTHEAVTHLDVTDTQYSKTYEVDVCREHTAPTLKAFTGPNLVVRHR